jgi:GrpB-like predicted nucleotidyltransferase (UPF0157 family)
MPTLIEIVPAQPSWRTDFETLKIAILRAAPAGSRVHHIGSTAVPGLAAKDIIDIQLTVEKLDSVNDGALATEGFERIRGLADHCPPGIDETELKKRFYESRGRPANPHVREGGRFNQRYALLCRDYLRTHPVAAGAYLLIKERLASRAPSDEDAYYEIKDPVFDIIMAGASEWAARTAWSEPPPD